MNAALSTPVGITAMGVGALALALAVLGIRGTQWFWRRGTPDVPDRNTVEGSLAYRRYLVAAACADGAGHHWERTVRPVLAEVLAEVLAAVGAQTASGSADDWAALRAAMGERLWALIDPRGCGTPDFAGPRIGQAELLELLELAEAVSDRTR